MSGENSRPERAETRSNARAPSSPSMASGSGRQQKTPGPQPRPQLGLQPEAQLRPQQGTQPGTQQGPQLGPQQGTQQGTSDEKCPICWGEMETRSAVNGCRHHFCFRCIYQWSRDSRVCPVCRRIFYQILTVDGLVMNVGEPYRPEAFRAIYRQAEAMRHPAYYVRNLVFLGALFVFLWYLD